MEYFDQIITTTIESFDFSFCIAVNIGTYVAIKAIDEINGTKIVPTIVKRLVFILITIILGLTDYLAGRDITLIVNSAILSPVFWSWIGKPICVKLGLDYRKNEN